MGSFGSQVPVTTHLRSGTYIRDSHAREPMSYGERDVDARSLRRILVDTHSRDLDRRRDVSDRTRMWVDTMQMRSSQVAKCMPKKYSGSGDPYAHVSLFKEVLRAEQITYFYTQYEGFRLTLEGTALTWFQPLNPETFPNINNVLREFAEKFSKRGIKHNTISQISAFRQRKSEKVKEASLRTYPFAKRLNTLWFRSLELFKHVEIERSKMAGAFGGWRHRASQFYFLIVLFSFPIFSIPCQKGTCSSPVEVAATHLLSIGADQSIAKALLYPGCVFRKLEGIVADNEPFSFPG
ncbi:hypothetical protein L7F22_024447 [Adiantum nelumboides]|nr:hypothetical protein [Adiantum nelumboides]